MKTILALLLGLTLASGARAEPTAPRYAFGMPQHAPGTLTVLSYNVEGLPWPAARRRSAAARAIARELRLLRAADQAPQVVAIQEGFRAADKRIGHDAGYAYAALGPALNDRGPRAATPADLAFSDHDRFTKGEGDGRHVDSGLAIFSDVPILWVRRQPFPAYACAGFDCLANKGMLAVALQAPGSDRPVVLIDTHLNSNGASKVSPQRSLYAHERQVDALDAFVRSVAAGAGSVILVGDFNVGASPQRAAYIRAKLVGDAGLTAVAAEHGAPGSRRLFDPASGGDIFPFARTMLLARGAMADAPVPGQFGRASDGSMLSDHIGVAVRFRATSPP